MDGCPDVLSEGLRPEFFMIEERSVNVSHRNELPGRDNINVILADVEEFFGL
jgi:hypothetical protein